MAPKRKQTSIGLERRVRARKEVEWEPESDSGSPESDDEVSEEDIRRPQEESEDEGSEEGSSGSQSSKDEDEQPPKVDFSTITFGALAKAQASLPQSSRKNKKASINDDDDNDEDESSNFRAQEKPKPKKKIELKRTSKHAPQEQSSKKAVSRRREILVDTRRKFRDPRFDPLAGKLDEAKYKKAYAFLDEYRDSEMTALRAEIKKTKNAAQKENLKRQLLSMESKRKADKKKEAESNVLVEHRKKEKEMVAQGKQPFYLKKSEQKRLLLTDQFKSMSKGQVDRAIERKRKKTAGRERKELDGLMRRP